MPASFVGTCKSNRGVACASGRVYNGNMPLLIAMLLSLLLTPPAQADTARTVHAGQKRLYTVHVPKQAGKARPLVIVLHDGGGTPKGIAALTGMNEAADEHGFIAAYPSGSGLKGGALAWNAGACCGSAKNYQSADTLFLGRLIDDAVENLHADPARVYVTGLGNGAQMAYRLACELPGRIAAAAPVGGQLALPSCKPARAVPILHLHGREDHCNRFLGGTCEACLFDNTNYRMASKEHHPYACRPVPATMLDLARDYACKGKPVEEDGCEVRRQCRDGAEIALCALPDAGHTWPGRDNEPESCKVNPEGALCQRWYKLMGKNAPQPDATARIWEFFSRYRLP